MGISTEQIEKALSATWVQPDHFVPIKKISMHETELFEQLMAIPSVQKQDVDAREYPLGEAAGHLIGYVGPITADELEKNSGKGYRSIDLIGKRGLEQVFEERLKGENGVKIIIKKDNGTTETLAEKEVKHGESVRLTIESKMQTTIFNELNGEAGTASAINPITGETLALVSSPSFNPNTISLGATAKQWGVLEDDPKTPLLNRFRAIMSPDQSLSPLQPQSH